MRDPDGFLFKKETLLIRQLKKNTFDRDHVLFKPSIKRLVENKLLVDFRLQSANEIICNEVGFVTHPYEWCDAQLFDAATVTLNVARELTNDRLEIKDASAWNIIFDGAKPVFCDHFSFREISTSHWLAFDHFILNFIIPLWISEARGLKIADQFKVSRNGFSVDQTKKILGLKRFLSPRALILLGSKYRKQPSPKIEVNNQCYHAQLFTLLEYLLGQRPTKCSGGWSSYRENRPHYPMAALEFKQKTISQLLSKITPEQTIDIGSNSGEYSKIASQFSKRTIAIDSDHNAIQRLYLSLIEKEQIYPVLLDLDDISSGRGWSSSEFPGILNRLRNKENCVLMLGLIHHLAIAKSIPLFEIAKLAFQLEAKHVVVELIEETDPMLVLLADKFRRDPKDFTIEAQRLAFLNFFSLAFTAQIPDTGRYIHVFSRKP